MLKASQSVLTVFVESVWSHASWLMKSRILYFARKYVQAKDKLLNLYHDHIIS